MKRVIALLGGIASLYAIALLLFDGFGDELASIDVARIAAAAFAGALLTLGMRRDHKWWKHRNHGFGPGELADVAKHAIDSDKAKAEQY